MRPELTDGERKELFGRARSVAEFSHAPYSKFRVGAAVLGKRGFYVGTNVENASSGLALCAERSALAAAVAAGDTDIRAIAVACVDAKPDGPRGALMPCGACRQWISELAPKSVVLVDGDAEYSIDELLPEPFRLH